MTPPTEEEMDLSASREEERDQPIDFSYRSRHTRTVLQEMPTPNRSPSIERTQEPVHRYPLSSREEFLRRQQEELDRFYNRADTVRASSCKGRVNFHEKTKKLPEGRSFRENRHHSAFIPYDNRPRRQLMPPVVPVGAFAHDSYIHSGIEPVTPLFPSMTCNNSMIRTALLPVETVPFEVPFGMSMNLPASNPMKADSANQNKKTSKVRPFKAIEGIMDAEIKTPEEVMRKFTLEMMRPSVNAAPISAAIKAPFYEVLLPPFLSGMQTRLSSPVINGEKNEDASGNPPQKPIQPTKSTRVRKSSGAKKSSRVRKPSGAKANPINRVEEENSRGSVYSLRPGAGSSPPSNLSEVGSMDSLRPGAGSSPPSNPSEVGSMDSLRPGASSSPPSTLTEVGSRDSLRPRAGPSPKSDRTEAGAVGSTLSNGVEGNSEVSSSQKDTKKTNGRRRRRKGNPVPEEEKDEAYYRKRDNNNRAAAASRLKRINKEDSLAVSYQNAVETNKVLSKHLDYTTEKLRNTEIYWNNMYNSKVRELEALKSFVRSMNCRSCDPIINNYCNGMERNQTIPINSYSNGIELNQIPINNYSNGMELNQIPITNYSNGMELNQIPINNYRNGMELNQIPINHSGDNPMAAGHSEPEF